MVKRIIKSELEIGCEGFERCELGKKSKVEGLSIMELSYCFTHCSKKGSYKGCRFMEKEENAN